jgi:plasmid stabilization system protein ParE
MSGFALHPEAFSDLDDIREHIAEDNPDAADRVITEIFDGIRALLAFPTRAIGAQTSLRVRCGSS